MKTLLLFSELYSFQCPSLKETVCPPHPQSRLLHPPDDFLASGGYPGCFLPSHSLGRKFRQCCLFKSKFEKALLCFLSDIHTHIRFRCSYKRKDGFNVPSRVRVHMYVCVCVYIPAAQPVSNTRARAPSPPPALDQRRPDCVSP